MIQTYQVAVNYGRVESADHEMGSLALDRVVQLDDGFKQAGKAWGEVEDESTQNLPCLNARMSKSVTLPMLFPEPFIATQRSVWSLDVA